MAGLSHLKVVAIAWVLPMGALVTEDLVVVVVGHLIHMRRLAVEAGAVAALPTHTSLGAAKRQHGALQKRLIHTLKGEEHRSIRVPKLQIRTRRKAGDGSGPGWGGTSPTWGGTTPKPSSWNESSSAPANNGWASPAPPTSGGWGEPTWVSPSEIDANSYSINSKPPTECANARFQRSDASVCTHSRWTRVWSNDVQCSDASRNVCQSF